MRPRLRTPVRWLTGLPARFAAPADGADEPTLPMRRVLARILRLLMEHRTMLMFVALQARGAVSFEDVSFHACQFTEAPAP